MSSFVGIPPFSNPLRVAMETMHFHIAHNPYQNYFEENFVSHSGGPNEQFGTHEKLSWVGCKVTQIGCPSIICTSLKKIMHKI